MIHFYEYERFCPNGVIPSTAVTRQDEKGDTHVLYIPTDKGVEFHGAEEPFVLGEGGRGSAKSYTLRWDAHLRNIAIPNHRALILRRTFPQLQGSHFAKVELEQHRLGNDICPEKFNSTKYFLKYSNGSILKFGHCESDAAINDYLSQEWDWIGFDELTTFKYDQFTRIAASARSAIGSNKRSFVRAATNPIGEGASWVKRYFIDQSVTEEENPGYDKASWRSIKMNVEDNPHLDAKEYKRTKLAHLGSEVLRRAYMDGEWLVEGQFFSQFKERITGGKSWHVIDKMPTLVYEDRRVPIHLVPWVQISRCFDWGYSELEPGYCAWVVNCPDGTAIVFKELVFTRQTPEEVAAQVLKMSEGLNVRMTVGGWDMFTEREGVSIAHRMATNGVSMYMADKDRQSGWINVQAWLSTVYNDGTGPRPRLQFLADDRAHGLGAPYAIRTLPSLQTDPKKPHDITQETGVEDHAADALRYWATRWPAPSHEPAKNLDWVAPEIRRAMGEALYGEEPPLGSESVGGSW